MTTHLAVQFLEPACREISPLAARRLLKPAFERLPVDAVLLGWDVTPEVEDACRDEATQHNARLLRWQPLLCGDGVLQPRPEWQTEGLDGRPVPGYNHAAEFTFMCPNRPAVHEAVLQRMEQLAGSGHYDGLFLDRIRFPSPAANPAAFLACFCTDCQQAAHAIGLDLQAVRRQLNDLLRQPGGARHLVMGLFGDGQNELLDAFMRFRLDSITRLVRQAGELLHAKGMEVGLDCFSPCLTRMVGQDLTALDGCGDWIKLITYGHTLGPAGLPYELLGLAEWLENSNGSETSLKLLSDATRLALPSTRLELRKNGISPAGLSAEVRRGRASGCRHLLAGAALVELDEINAMSYTQARAEVRALLAGGADGLVLSWDLRWISSSRMRLASLEWRSLHPA